MRVGFNGVCDVFALADGPKPDSHQFFEQCKSAAAKRWLLEDFSAIYRHIRSA